MLDAFQQLDHTTRFLVVVVLLMGLYLLSGFFYPYTACSVCKGQKNFSPSGKNWAECGKCGGSGKKIRLISRFLGRGK
ncbi:hypothetical protein DMC63_37680 [Streptomyces sp. WAC 05977]|nr:hypothetical protein DMC63_37680 [Streptomyces sp. WAC 05977]